MLQRLHRSYTKLGFPTVWMREPFRGLRQAQLRVQEVLAIVTA